MNDNDNWLTLGCALLAIMLALIGIVLPESGSFPPNYPYNNLTGIPNTFPYGNLTGIPNTFPYSNVTGIPNNYPYGNLTGIPQSFPYGNLTGVPSAFPYSNLTGIPQTFPYSNLTGVPNVDLMHGLTVWLPLDGVPLDKSGYRYDGSVVGGSYVLGKFAKGLSFNGTNGYVEVVDSASVRGLQNFSLSCWVYFNGLPTHGVLFSKGDYVDCPTVEWVFEGYGNSLRLLITDGSSWKVNLQTAYGVVSTGSWYFLCVTFSGLNVSIYINNVLSTFVVVSSFTVNSVVKSLSLGNRIPNKDFGLDGVLDDVRVYNRVLNQAEITLLYNLP